MAKVSLRAYNQEIETMIDRGHLDEAIAHCRHILKTFPKHLETYRLLGKAYLEYKRYAEAADIFSRVLVGVPNDFVSNVGMSIIRDEENKLDDAIWHMERAFETQPSNAAIQSELQRLYGRREGMQPPRIRMTRGALAHMYVQGELYPQAISEIKSVLKDDPSRSDMQVLLARAYFRSGLKNDATEVASTVLRNNPYNLDANRVLVEILGTDHPESVQTYRQRVVEMDPYAAQVTGSIFLSNEVPDAAVSLEHLDWNGQPVGMQPDWQSARAISLENEPAGEEQPDWLKNAFDEQMPARSSQPESVSPFDAAVPPAPQAEPAEEIPDFLRAAGWGHSTGAFDESKSSFVENEPAAGEPAIEQGDLPDWVKAMAPQQQAETPAEQEDLPDWINQIGTSALPVPSETANELDWMKDLGQAPAQPAEDQPDWLSQLAQGQAATPPAAEEPDWLKGFESESQAVPAETPEADLDWLTQLSQETGAESQSTEAASREFDFLSQPAEPLDLEAQTPTTADLGEAFGEAAAQPEPALSDEFDFLDPLGNQFRRIPASSDDFDFLNELTPQAEPPATPSTLEPAKAGPLGMSEEEQDDSFAWLESLAAKQGATEGLLTKPEERREEEPDWVKQAKSMETAAPEPAAEQPSVVEPAASLESLGMSEAEQDDSFAWLESLAAKQGATEGLLTKPEERREEEPDWVKQAKGLEAQVPEAPVEPVPELEQPVVTEPAASLEALGTTEQEREDSFAWLEALAAKQGASEGLLTRPEERPEEEPEWVKQARDLGEVPAVAPEPIEATDETAVWLQGLETASATAQPEGTLEEQPDWLKATSEPPTEPAEALDEIDLWLKGLEGKDVSQPESVTQEAAPAEELSATFFESEQVTEKDDTDAWLQSLDTQAALSQLADRTEESAPVEEPVAAQDTATWLESLDREKVVPEEEISSADDTAIWLKSLGEEERVAPEPAPEQAPEMQPTELPAWMESIEEEDHQTQVGIPAVQEPAAELPEATDWMSAIEEQPELATPEVPKVDTGSLPSWLRGLEEEEAERATFGAQADLPAWLRDETGEALAEPGQIEPTRAADWHRMEGETTQAEPEPVMEQPVTREPAAPEPVLEEVTSPQPESVDVVAILEEKIAEPEPEPVAAAPKPQREPPARKVTGGLTDPILGQARGELNRSNVSGALDNYGRLIRKGRLLEDIIYDLREASYRYPVDVGIWQSLGDAYMRANRLQDALDAYTKAEELLR